MTTYAIRDIKNDMLGALQTFLTEVFVRGGLDAIIAPSRDSEGGLDVDILRSKKDFERVDPLAPFLLTNSAKLALEYVQNHPKERVGLVMRPCELRAFETLARWEGYDHRQALVIGVECIGTLDAEAMGTQNGLDSDLIEMLQFARQGGIATYRYRPACQMCDVEMPEWTDLVIGLVGMPARRVILVTTSPEADSDLGLSEFVEGMPTAGLITQHDRVKKQLKERRERAQARIIERLQKDLIKDVDAFIAHLDDCETCKTCFENCPLYASAMKAVETPLEQNRETITRWLASCAGCGMCEATCPDHLPLTTIIASIREDLIIEGATL